MCRDSISTCKTLYVETAVPILNAGEKHVRLGTALPMNEQGTTNDTKPIKTTISPTLSQPFQTTVTHTLSQPSLMEAVHTDVPTTSSESRFQFTFRQKVKGRRRPKRPAKQLCSFLCSFNKSSADREAKTEKPRPI